MSDLFLLAFVIAPAAVIMLGWAAVRLHEWADDRDANNHRS
jgi:hypothetical protein